MTTINEARVIKIPGEYSILVNVGKNDGLHIGDTLEVYAKGEKIIDPYSKNELGTLDYIKARVEITSIYENMCLCKNTEYNDSLSLAASLSTTMRGQRRSLPVDDKEITGDFSKFDKTIRIGDYVRSAL
jgi:hypothetical protein